MSKSLDDVIIEYFQPEKLKAAFEDYEKSKTDFFNPDEIKVQMGADGISYQTFKKELDLRCQLLSNRLLKGTYQFYTFREVKVPKPSGGTRCLSIATIRDVLVQKVLYEAIYNDIEKDFQATNQLDKVSCAYRKGKSAPFAASLINCNGDSNGDCQKDYRQESRLCFGTQGKSSDSLQSGKTMV